MRRWIWKTSRDMGPYVEGAAEIPRSCENLATGVYHSGSELGQPKRKRNSHWRCGSCNAVPCDGGECILTRPPSSRWTSIPWIEVDCDYRGATTGIEDGASLTECLARATDTSEISKCLHAFETIRKPRLTFIQNEGLGRAKMFHLPDGPTQQARDEMFCKNPMMIPPTWDGKHIDNPADESRRDLGLAYVAGHRVIDFVSLFCLHLHISGTPQAVITNREFALPAK